MKKWFFILAALLTVGFYSCKKDSKSGTTHVSVKLTDAPGAYDAINLSIKSVVIITDKGQYTLPVGPASIDILQFSLGKDTLLASQDIPAGTIQQIRLVLNTSGNTIVVGGISSDLTTPSGQTS